MVEKQDDLKGLTWEEWLARIRREFPDVTPTCNCCACCYDRDGMPTWCQVYSHSVDPTDIAKNFAKGAECISWVPYGADRSKVERPDILAYYEKDSMG